MSTAQGKEFVGRIPILNSTFILNEDTYPMFFPQTYLSTFLKPSTMTLLRGDGDLDALGLFLAASSTGWEKRIYYFHGSPIPQFDRFPELITQLQPQNQHKIPLMSPGGHSGLFPLELEGVHGCCHHGFCWGDFDQNDDFYAILKKIPEKSLIFISDFKFIKNINPSNNYIRKLLKNGSAIVLVDVEDNAHGKLAMFDTVFTCSLKQKARYNPRNLFVAVQDCRGETSLQIHMFSPTDRIFWIEEFAKYERFRPIITTCVHMKLTAATTIKVLLTSHPPCLMTLATLARLKRKWGLRTYRPEKHPRAPKKPKNKNKTNYSAPNT